MSYVIDLLLVAILVLTAVFAAKRGFFATLFDLAGYVVSLVAAKVISSSAAPGIFSEYFEAPVRERLVLSLGDVAKTDYASQIESAVSSIPESLTGVMQLIGIDREELIQKVSSENFKGSDLVDGIMETIAVPVGTAIVRTVLFVALCVVLSFVLKIVVRLLDKVIKKLPAIRQVNSGLGFVLGVLKGIIVVVIVSLLLGVVCGFIGYEPLIKGADDSIIINIVKGLMKSISGYRLA